MPIVPDQRAPERVTPRWPSWLRSGAPPASGPGLWPFDAELVGLELGLRTLVKREHFTEVAADTDGAWLAGQGILVSRPDLPRSDARRVTFGARSERALHDAQRLEGLLARSETSKAASAELGRLLGYPDCCVEAHANLATRDDASLLDSCLPRFPYEPASPLTLWLAAPLALVSHTPCSLRCKATARLASTLLTELDRRHRGFRHRWEHLARRVHVLDAAGRCFLLESTGNPDAPRGAEVASATELLVPSQGGDVDVMREHTTLRGERLRCEDGRLMLENPSAGNIAWAADHRGAVEGSA